MSYQLIDLIPTASDLEQLGTKEKFWFIRQYLDEDNNVVEPFDEVWLFKFSREDTGEHWSEKCAEQLCNHLGIPHAEYELSETDGRPGVITRNLIPDGCRMVMGNEVLHNTTADYPQPLSDDEKAVRVKEHTVTRVLACLDKEGIAPPPSIYDLGNLNAADVFCGYLMLDALISNQDRHHENWAIMLNNETGETFLCPTYDHAASLGRELVDAEREDRMTSKDVGRQIPRFVRRARSELFKLKSDRRPLLTVDAFLHAVEHRQHAKAHWLGRLADLSEDSITEIFEAIPDRCITEHARQFAIKMVMENRRRLLEDES